MPGRRGGGQHLLQRRQRARIGEQHQFVEVGNDIVDRADRASGFVGERASLEAGKTPVRNGAGRGVDQRRPQLLSSDRRFHRIFNLLTIT